MIDSLYQRRFLIRLYRILVSGVPWCRIRQTVGISLWIIKIRLLYRNIPVDYVTVRPLETEKRIQTFPDLLIGHHIHSYSNESIEVSDPDLSIAVTGIKPAGYSLMGHFIYLIHHLILQNRFPERFLRLLSLSAGRCHYQKHR